MRYSPAPFIFLPTFCRISCVLHFIGGDWLQVGSCFKSSERLKERHPRAGTPTVNFISVVQAQVNQRKRRFNAKIRTLYVQHAPVIQTYWNTLKQWNHTESLVCAAIWVYFESLECEIFIFAKEARCQQCSRTRVGKGALFCGKHFRESMIFQSRILVSPFHLPGSLRQSHYLDSRLCLTLCSPRCLEPPHHCGTGIPQRLRDFRFSIRNLGF